MGRWEWSGRRGVHRPGQVGQWGWRPVVEGLEKSGCDAASTSLVGAPPPAALTEVAADATGSPHEQLPRDSHRIM